MGKKITHELFFLIALGLISLTGNTLLLSSLTFLAGGSLGWWQFPVAMLLSLGINYTAARHFLSGRYLRVFLYSSLAVLVVVFLSILAAGSIIDTSGDGQFYHQETVYQLKNGWNPFYQHELKEKLLSAVWVLHYPRGAEIPQAAIYSLTGHIECGKATNLMFVAGVFCLCNFFFSRLSGFTSRKAFFYSVLVSFNTIAVNQLLTYYVDGQLACLLSALILVMGLLSMDPADPFFRCLFFFIILQAVNVKFTGLVLTVALCGLFLVFLFLRGQWKGFRSAGPVMIYACLAGVIIAGYSPYVTNTIYRGHPFYPVMGPNHLDVISDQYPVGFERYGRVEKFFVSFFSHTDNPGTWLTEKRSVQLKLPFTLNEEDISRSKLEDARVGGFGPFFSGVCLLAVVLAALCYLKGYAGRAPGALWIVPAGLLLSVLLIPESWWARFVPQMWLLPVSLLLMVSGVRVKWVQLSAKLTGLLILVNICFSLLSVPYRISRSEQVKYQLSQLKSLGKPVKVEWRLAAPVRIRFMENGVSYTEQRVKEDSTTGYILCSNAMFEKQGTLPPVPRSFMQRLFIRQ